MISCFHRITRIERDFLQWTCMVAIFELSMRFSTHLFSPMLIWLAPTV
jgi:hypothetical protein